MLQRIITPRLQQAVGKGKVVLLTGARRVGKTVLLRELSRLKSNSLWLNAEDSDTQALLSERKIATYKSLMQDRDLVVIDEAQSIPHIGAILKLIIDEMPNIPIIASGSSSFNLLNQSGEPLTGRYSRLELFPLSWKELSLNFNPLERKQQLEERLVFGSYPEVITLTSSQDKRLYLKELVNSYLLRDILAFDGLRNTAKLLDLLKLVAFQVGSELSFEELGKQLGMSKNTVERYLYILKEGYVIFPLGGFSRNLRKEVSKSSKWYFYDNGIRNAIINQFDLWPQRNDIGALWENFCISERIKKSSYERDETEFYFWRTYDRQEIDLIEERLGSLQAVEFKWKDKPQKTPLAWEKSYPKATNTLVSQQNFETYLS
jgi:predicted AAA+ superfamily ATPase